MLITEIIKKHMFLRISLIVLLLPLELNFLIAQESESVKDWTVENILTAQNTFLQENFTEYLLHLDSIRKLDETIKTAQLEWKKEAKKKYKGFTKLLSHTYIFFLKERNSTGVINDEKLKHVVINYQIPAFADEYEYFRKNPNYSNSIFIYMSRNNFLFPHKYDFPVSLWKRLHEIYEDMPRTISTYLNTVDFTEESTKLHLETMRWELIGQKPLWEIEECIYQGDFVSALHKITENLTVNTNNAQWTIKLGRRLALNYSNKGKIKNAFYVLDKIIRTASEEVILTHFNKLKECYVKIDSLNGKMYFTEIMAERKFRQHVPNINQFEISDKYEDAISGKLIDIHSFRGKYVFLDFWTTWCSPCRAEIPNLKKFVEQHNDRDDFVFLSINGDLITGGAGKDGIRDFIRQFEINYITLIDNPKNSLTRYFEVKSWPSKFLFDKNLKVIFSPKDSPTLQMIAEYLKKNY